MYGMTKKEFHTLVTIQWRRLLEGKNKDDSSGITSITVKYTSGNTRELYILLDTGSKDITW